MCNGIDHCRYPLLLHDVSGPTTPWPGKTGPGSCRRSNQGCGLWSHTNWDGSGSEQNITAAPAPAPEKMAGCGSGVRRREAVQIWDIYDLLLRLYRRRKLSGLRLRTKLFQRLRVKYDGSGSASLFITKPDIFRDYGAYRRDRSVCCFPHPRKFNGNS